MDKKMNRLIQSLRAELRQYAEMFALLDEHYQVISHLSAENFDEFTCKIKIQGEVVKRVRRKRDMARRDLAKWLGLEAGISTEKMLPLLPEHCQPLVNGLIQANGKMLAEVLQSLRRNQLLLTRCLSRTRHYLNRLFPGDFEKTDHATARNTIAIPAMGPLPVNYFKVQYVNQRVASISLHETRKNVHSMPIVVQHPV
jgi:hypothetical protein